MDAFSAGNDFTGPLIDEYFPAPEVLQDLYERRTGPVHKDTATINLQGALYRKSLRVAGIAAVILSLGCICFLPFISASRSIALLSSKVVTPPNNIFKSPLGGIHKEFTAFRTRYGRSYQPGSPEYSERLAIFRENMKYINDHNTHSGARYTLAPNQFTDMSTQEWSDNYLNPFPADWKERREASGRQVLWNLALVANDTLPNRVNWEERGCVTPVKDQARCGSCWAFSTTGAIEGAICAQTGKLVNLSEQQLVDCARAEGTHGCNGGFMDNAYNYVMHAGGLCSEEDYPYMAADGQCVSSCKKVAKISNIMDIPHKNPKALRAGIAFHGPVSAGIEADKPVFQFYHSGVFDLACGKKLNHAILITGYDHDPEADEDYWIVKNSWGSTWGSSGYIRLGCNNHGRAGECGILLAPSLPIANKDDLLV